MVFQAEERAKAKKQQTDTAIQLALQGRWDEAVSLNKAIISRFPADADAYNRLGKALTELGRYGEAREAYQKAQEIDPLNSIARKNLSRLAIVGKKMAPRRATQKLSPQMFIEETGKTSVTMLLRPKMEVAARMSAGDEVNLMLDNGSLVVGSTEGEFIGETFQHPSQLGKLSFPPAVTEAFRPYVKERLIRQDSPDEAYYDSEDGEDWETSRDSHEAEVAVHQFGGKPGGDQDSENEESDEGEEE